MAEACASRRYDPWLVLLLAVAGAASCIVFPVLRFVAPGERPGPAWLAFVALPIWVLALAATLPQYYEVREEGLFIRQGWRRILLPYGSLVELQSVSSALSAAVFSTQRLLITTAGGARLLIAVLPGRDRAACAQLERRPFGLGTPFAPPTVV